MKISDKTLALSFLAILTCSGVALARNVDVRLRISQMEDDEKVVTRNNLLKIKQFILQNGRRETYCNKFNNNPAYHTKEFQLYLDPDAGQLNGNCDPAKSDFNTLTIRSTNGGKNQYRKVEFIDQHSIHVVASWPTDDLTVGQLRKFVEEALDLRSWLRWIRRSRKRSWRRRRENPRSRTRRSIQRRVTLQFEFGLPSPPWMT